MHYFIISIIPSQGQLLKIKKNYLAGGGDGWV